MTTPTVAAPTWPRLNADLLRRVLTHITEHPEQHDQSSWAGKAVRRASDGALTAVLPQELSRAIAAYGGPVPLEHITEKCDTVCCFAGWAVAFSGARWAGWNLLVALPDDPPEHHVYDTDAERVDPRAAIESGCVYVGVGSRAQRLLGLTSDEAYVLFHRADGLREVRETVDRIMAGEYRDGHPPECSQGDALCPDCLAVADVTP